MAHGAMRDTMRDTIRNTTCDTMCDTTRWLFRVFALVTLLALGCPRPAPPPAVSAGDEVTPTAEASGAPRRSAAEGDANDRGASDDEERDEPAVPSTMVRRQVAGANLAAVWAIDDGTKVAATERSHRLARRNGVFDGRVVRLFAARNEVVAFQLILEGGKRATNQVQVRLGRVGAIANGRLHASPDGHFLGRRIELFKQHYLNLQTRSRDLAWLPNSAAAPRVSGWIPDALIPLGADDTFTVPARRNQGVWIDVYVPKTTSPGVHRGRLELRVGGAVHVELPVEIEVLAATLPDVPTVKTMLYFSGSDDDRDVMASRYFDDPWSVAKETVDRLRDRHYKLGRHHRVTMIVGRDRLPDPELGARLRGTAFSRDAGYEGPGEGVGQDLYSILTYGGVLAPSQARTWAEWFGQYAPGVPFFLYVADEPGRADFGRISRIAAQAGPVPAFVTHAYTPALKEFDIFCALADHYTPANAADARAAGKQLWIYNGVRPFTGTFVTDDVAISPRVNPWIQYRFNIPRWFYWESTYYKDDQGRRGQIDVFSQPINFSNRDGDKMNGDGLLIYPGRDRLFPKQDRGLDLPLPSIRLKNWRRGIQDVEYLALASARGHRQAVEALLRRMIPRALAHQTRAGRRVAWSEDGEVWLQARRQLARLLARGGP